MPGGSSSRPAWMSLTASSGETFTCSPVRMFFTAATPEAISSEEALDRLDRKLEQTMRAVEASYEKNKERWVDTLFSLIVGVQP